MTPKTLDGKIPTLDASQLSYEFEKARIKGVEGTNNLLREYSKQENVAMPPTFEYVSSFRDPVTGMRGLPLKMRQVERPLLLTQVPTRIVTW